MTVKIDVAQKIHSTSLTIVENHQAMRTTTVLSLMALCVGFSELSESSPALGEELNSWPGFRGEGNSITYDEKLPLKWSEKEGVAWRVSLEG